MENKTHACEERRHTLGYLMNILIPSYQLCRNGNAPRRLDLVAREHPNLDSSIPEQLKRPLHLVLQLILDARQAKQLQVVLKVLCDDRSHCFASSIKPDACSMVCGLKRRILLRREPLACDDERAQALTRHVPGLLFEPVVSLHD